MNPLSEITDLDRAKFMEKLHDARADLNLSPWVLNFLAGFKRSYRSWQWMTDGRRAACDDLRIRFGPAVGMPLPLSK